MPRKLLIRLALLAFACAQAASAQQLNPPRIGVVLEGGIFHEVVAGLKEGLRALGLEDGRHYLLETRDLKGDAKGVANAARDLERDKVKLIYAISTSVATATKHATTEVPIVFAVGRDPVTAGLVDSLARPGGRLTGVHFLSADLTAKRLEILKTVLPNLRRAVTFYDPANASAQESARVARDAARQLRIDLIERQVDSPEALRQGMLALRPQDADAFFYTNDAMITSQAKSIIEIAKSKRLPTMFFAPSFAEQGALIAYGVSYREVGRLSAKYVQRVLAGDSPREMPVEAFSKLSLVLNLKVARELGITIPGSVLLQADDLIH